MTLCANNTPSTNEYTGNGAVTEYSITFQYYSQSDIYVAFYDTATEAWVSVSNSNWSFLNPTVIKFNTAPADNQRILIYRCTDIDPLPAEFFPGNSIKAADLNNNFFVMKSAIEEINTQAGSSDTLAQSAKATADAANTKADTAISTANTASTNASSAVTTANTADTNATSALNAANSATATANTALSTANTANTTANTANTTANTANTAATAASSDASAAVSSANAAVTTANVADTNATTALNTANTVSGVANTANTNATTALNTANTALTTANTANTTANNALSQVTAANPWTESSGVVSLFNSGSKGGIGLTNPIFPLEVSRTGGTVVSSFKSDQSSAWVNIASTSTDLLNVRVGATGNDAVIHAGGSEKVRVRSNGNVGVGTSSPSAALHLSASNAATLLRLSHTDATSYYSIGRDTSGNLRISDSTYGELIRVQPNGNVGIGTSNPEDKLHIKGGNSAIGSNWSNAKNLIRIEDTDNSQANGQVTGGIIFEGNDSDAPGIQAGIIAQAGSGTGGGDIAFHTAASGTTLDGTESARMVIDSSGHLGIGTSNPARPLTVESALNNPVRIASSATYSRIEFSSGASTDPTNVSIGASGDDFRIFAGTNGNTSTRLTVTSSGNTGIGTTTPSQKLEVAGNVSVVGGGNLFMQTGARVQFGTSDAASIIGNQGSSGYLAFSVNNEAMRILPNGRVGIGTSNPLAPLSISSAGQNIELNPQYATNLGRILFYDRGNNAYMQGMLKASLFRFDIGTTEAMRLDANGRLGIATSNPSQRLQVAGGSIQLDSNTGVAFGDFNTRLQGSVDGAYTFYGNSAARMSITSTGLVGIGTSSPTRNLVVNKSTANSWVSVRSSNTGRAGILLGDQTSDAMAQLAYDNNTEALQFVSAGLERMRLTAIPGGTRLGIGTSSPDSLLHLRASSPELIIDRATAVNTTGGTEEVAKITAKGQKNGISAPVGSIIFRQDSTTWSAVNQYHKATRLEFCTQDSGTSDKSEVPRLIIDRNGAVEIPGNLTVGGTINGSSGGGGGGGGAVSSSYVNVKDFGAVGNGTTDDTPAVRNALNGGGTIYFPAGTYRITSTLSHTSAFNVVGDGQQSRIMFDASSNNQNLFNLETNVRHNNAKKWSFSSIALSCKAVTNRVHAAGIRIAYTGAATVIGGTNYLELNDVHIVSEITTDATQAYFRYGLSTVNIGGIVADNLNISSFNVNTENDTSTVGILIENGLEGHAVIRAFTGNNIYIQRYYRGLHATKAGGGQNIESIYMTQGEIVCNKGIDLAASHATFINGMHIECQRESYINTSDGGPHRVVGCDLRGGRNGTQNLTDYIIKIGVDNCSITGNYITAQMPSTGCIKTGGSVGNPDNVSIVGNIFNGNGSSTYRALSCESGSSNVIFSANIGSGFGGNSNPVFNQIGTGQGKLNNTTNEFL